MFRDFEAVCQHFNFKCLLNNRENVCLIFFFNAFILTYEEHCIIFRAF